MRIVGQIKTIPSGLRIPNFYILGYGDLVFYATILEREDSFICNCPYCTVKAREWKHTSPIPPSRDIAVDPIT